MEMLIYTLFDDKNVLFYEDKFQDIMYICTVYTILFSKRT